MNADLTADATGCVDGAYPDYNGLSTSTRVSAMGGVVIRINGPLYLRAGAGYGLRNKSWYTQSGYMVTRPDLNFSSVDLSAGLQLNLKGFTLTCDAVAAGLKALEVKVGLGYCWKKK